MTVFLEPAILVFALDYLLRDALVLTFRVQDEVFHLVDGMDRHKTDYSGVQMQDVRFLETVERLVLGENDPNVPHASPAPRRFTGEPRHDRAGSGKETRLTVGRW